MKVAILAGGYGTRPAEESEIRPKVSGLHSRKEKR